MKPTPGRPRAGHSRKAPPRPTPLKVFIGYGDVSAMRHATYTVGGAVRSSRRNVEIHPLLWRFAQLSSSHWRDRAITAALEADIIVLACSSASLFTPTLEAWVNAVLAASRGRRATIVAIFGHAEAWTISLELPAAEAAVAETPARLVA